MRVEARHARRGCPQACGRLQSERAKSSGPECVPAAMSLHSSRLQPASNRSPVAGVCGSQVPFEVTLLFCDDDRSGRNRWDEHQKYPKVVEPDSHAELHCRHRDIHGIATIAIRACLDDSGAGSVWPQRCLEASELSHGQRSQHDASHDHSPSEQRCERGGDEGNAQTSLQEPAKQYRQREGKRWGKRCATRESVRRH